MESKLNKDFSDWIFNGNAEKVQVAIDAGINLNEVYPEGMTPLIIAVEGDQPKILDLLLKNGANPNLRSGINGTTALHWAVEYAMDGMIQNGKETPYSEPIECITILLAHGADKNVKDENGKTPLDFQMTDEIRRVLNS